MLTNEQLTNINNTLRKQRDEAELKVTLLTLLIENELWPEHKVKSDLIAKELVKIGV